CGSECPLDRANLRPGRMRHACACSQLTLRGHRASVSLPPMPKPTATSIPSDRLAAFDRLIATQPDLVRKGATIPYTSLNGHMTSYLTDSGSLVLRLSPEDRARFLAGHQTGLHVAVRRRPEGVRRRPGFPVCRYGGAHPV